MKFCGQKDDYLSSRISEVWTSSSYGLDDGHEAVIQSRAHDVTFGGINLTKYKPVIAAYDISKKSVVMQL